MPKGCWGSLARRLSVDNFVWKRAVPLTWCTDPLSLPQDPLFNARPPGDDREAQVLEFASRINFILNGRTSKFGRLQTFDKQKLPFFLSTFSASSATIRILWWDTDPPFAQVGIFHRGLMLANHMIRHSEN
jgi:hypothetical protein